MWQNRVWDHYINTLKFAPERWDVVLAGHVVTLENVGDGGDLVDQERHPGNVGDHEHQHDHHHCHRHSDIIPTKLNAFYLLL